jgi:hypothetical protein
MKYNVSIDIRQEFEVDASSMDEALAKAICFQETMKTGWGDTQNDTVSWINTETVKHAVSHDINLA